MEKSERIPKNWKWAKIEDITDVVRGASPRPKGDPRYFGGNIPWIMIRDISREKGKFITKTKDHVTKTGSLKSRLLKKGSLILSNSGTVCVPKILGMDGCIHDGFVAFPMIAQNIEILYAFYWFEYVRSKIIQENQQGITQVNLNTTIVKNIDIPIPPLNEQKKIVNKIETIFSMINFEQQTLEKTANTLELYRRSLLKKIFNKVTNRVPLSSISKINPYPEKNKFPDELDVTFIPMKNVEAMTGNINSSIVRKFKDVRKGYTFFEEGDLLFAKITPCMENGKIALARGLVNKIGFGSTEFHVIQFKDKEILPKFYFWYLIQDEFRNVAQRNMKGTAGQLRVSTDYMKNIFVPYTSKSEQNKIIIEIENSITKLKKQQDLIRFSLEKICLLKKSILKHAFEGKLIPQDPDDEPAGILLEKIKQNKITKC